jgi:hypothetical protein
MIAIVVAVYCAAALTLFCETPQRGGLCTVRFLLLLAPAVNFCCCLMLLSV